MYHSIVEYSAQHESYKCGYCRSPDTNYSHGMWAHSMTVTDYQDLIDRGWRRSGKYCYKPTMDLTCCPMYTIRCKALEFKATKSQKKVLKRFNKYLAGQEEAGDNNRKMSTCSTESDTADMCGEGGEQFVESTLEHRDINIEDVAKCMENTKDFRDTEMNAQGDNIKSSDSASSSEVITKTEIKKGAGLDPNKAPTKKAKLMRLERKLEKLKEKGVQVSTLAKNSQQKEKNVEDFINEIPEAVKDRLQIKLVRTKPPGPEWFATAKETHRIYVKYQTTVHNDKPAKCSEPKFRDFLVQSPLMEEYRDDGPPCGYGSFHQQYWLDGNLIAVGVIDILPKCVSSVYFFYDPGYMHLTLGTYGALREIAFMRHLHTFAPELNYYYMGYYIHSCKKMRYKGNFYPSDLLCPETYKWCPLKDCIPKLEKSPYSRLDSDLDSIDENYPTDSQINYIPVFVNGTVLTYKNYKRKVAGSNTEDMDELKQYAKLVGAKAAMSLVLVR